MLALFGRAQAHDFVDVAALAARLGFDRVCELAAEKDPGFSRTVLREMLGSFDRFSTEDLDLDEVDYLHLTQTVLAWREHLTNSLPQQPRGPAGGLSV
jgi:hypothetical protein